MQHPSEGSTSPTTGINAPSNEARTSWRANVSNISSARHFHLTPLTAEERDTYRRWKRAIIAFYAALACFTAVFFSAFGIQQSRIATTDLRPEFASSIQRPSR
jgi:hypothetical protein